MKNTGDEIEPSIGDFAVANLSPNLDAIGAYSREPGITEPVRSEEVDWPTGNIDQGLSVHSIILAKVALRVTEYVANPAFINCDRWHSRQS